jgi:hypothetical protein
VDSNGNLLTPQSLEKQLAWIMNDADKRAGTGNNSSCTDVVERYGFCSSLVLFDC